ncbi:hypothetical protein [Streptomyces sp. BE303]|uniref:hypothetical protein n=1 Tax=Streptomyces sp. BE303 TaxID=3002528 RepID=UPI002E78240F|nr:hypothetical protein [Streptomyces sp. BE303]MED7952601.1 hypothetical protein [Streptomyces sp. BE303]
MRADLVLTIGEQCVRHRPWKDALRTPAHACRDTFAERPGIIRLPATAPLAEPFTHELYERAVPTPGPLPFDF